MEFVHPIRDVNKIEAMKYELKSKNLRDYCLFVMGINTGLRVCELLKLTIADVLDERGKVRGYLSIIQKESNISKKIILCDNAKIALDEYLLTRQPNPEEPLFKSRKGKGEIQRAQAWKIINEVAKSVGIQEKIGTHTLRKTFAYHAFLKGTDLTLLQKILNHKSPATTLRYIGITQEEKENVFISLNL